MSSLQGRFVLLALLLEEASWLFAAFGILGVILDGGGSPLGWVAVLAVSSASLLVVRFLQYLLLPSLPAQVVQMLTGVVVVYMVVGTQVGPTFQGVDMGWLGVLFSGEGTTEYIFRAIIGSFAGACLWWRGGHLAALEFPEESLTGSFKVGIMVLAVATVIDIAYSSDLQIYPVMFIFFASSIAGMSIAHLAPASSRAAGDRAWTRIIGIVVGTVLVMGLLFSLLQGTVLSAIASPIIWVLNMIATVIFFVIIMPLAYLVDLISRWLFRFVQSFAEPQQQGAALSSPFGIADELRTLREGGAEEPVAELLLQFLQWSIVVAIVIGVLFLLARAYRRRSDSRQRTDDGRRDSVREQADAVNDLAKLLLGLLPSRLRRSKKSLPFRVPNDEPNIVEVFRIYFGMLVKAEESGLTRPPSATPNEYRRKLEGVLSPNLVRRATAAFVRACYGHHPSSRQDIDEMREELEQESSRISKSK